MMVLDPQPLDNLVVTGMEVAWAGCDGLEAFERLVYAGGSLYAGVNGNGEILPPGASESLLNKVARAALTDAGIDPNHTEKRILALVAAGTPLDIHWQWAASTRDLSYSANPLVTALKQAQQELSTGMADAVVFAAGAGLPELPADTRFSGVTAALGFDREVHGWRFGEGAGAVVFMKRSEAREEGRRIYAIVHALESTAEEPAATVLPEPPALERVRECCRAAHAAAGIGPEQVGYIEAFASGSDALDGMEIAGLVQSYRVPHQDLTTALGSVQSNAGYLGAASGLAGLVRAALCLYHRIIPGTPGWTAPKLPALWRGAPFYVPGESRTWFDNTSGPGRFAGLDVVGRGGAFAHMILGESVEQPARSNNVLKNGGFYLIPLAADSRQGLLDELTDLQKSLVFATDLRDLAVERYEMAQDAGDAAYALAILGHDHAEVGREIELALKAVPACFENGTEWQTPVGSYFTPEPAGSQGGVALVYPGAFNTYPGVGKDLFWLFPDLHQRVMEISSEMGKVMREKMLYPRSLAAISKEELAALETRLLGDAITMLISGTAMSILYTHILREKFGIHPAAAFGYSLGENSMLYAVGVWGQGEKASERLEESDAFNMRLAGPQLAVREFWGMPAEDSPGGEPLWSNYLVMAAPDKVSAALEKEPRVYMTHVNTPRQVVIGGDPAACKRVLAELRCSSLQAPFDYALHCEVMRSEYNELAELHNWPVEKKPEIKMYSAADYCPLNLEQAEIAQKMAQMLTSPLDFPHLIRQVYADGARVFIEAGAGSNCARWIDESLKGSPHLAISMNRRGTDDYTTLVRTMARLYSHRVPMNLQPLFQFANIKVDL